MTYGYMGKILTMDLTTQKVDEKQLNLSWAGKYIGGSGLAARYLYEAIKPTTRPDEDDNPLIFMTGPLGGTRSITSGRHQVVSLSPLTGIFGEADVGGTWGKALKAAGCNKDIYVVATHGLLSGPAIERMSGAKFKEVVVTDTFPIAKEKQFPGLKILSAAELLGEAVRRNFEHQSISSLFD